MEYNVSNATKKNDSYVSIKITSADGKYCFLLYNENRVLGNRPNPRIKAVSNVFISLSVRVTGKHCSITPVLSFFVGVYSTAETYGCFC